MPILSLLLILVPSLHVQVLQQGAFMFDRVEIADPITINLNGYDQTITPGKAIKLTFHGTSNHPNPLVVMGPPREGAYPYAGVHGFFTNLNPDFKTNVCWIPTDYPSSVNGLKLTIHDQIDRQAADTVLLVTGIPTRSAELPNIQDSVQTGPRTVKGTASLNEPGESISTELRFSGPSERDGWYWETRALSPYTPIAPGTPNSRVEEAPYEANISDYATVKQYHYCPLLDRVVVDGSLSHFTSEGQEVAIQGIRPAKGALADIPFETPDGIRGTVTNPGRKTMFVSRPEYSKALQVRVVLDPKTISAGIGPLLAKYGKKTPDRVDIYTQIEGVAWRRGPTHYTGIDTADGYAAQLQRGIVIALYDSQSKPKINFRLAIVRRIADQSFPFHLVVPVSKGSQF